MTNTNDWACRIGQEGYESSADCPCGACAELCWWEVKPSKRVERVELPVFEVINLTPAEVALELLADRLAGHRTSYVGA